MAETDSSSDMSKEAVRRIKSLLETEISSESKKDLDAIHILAEDTGSCIFKVNKWTDPISLSGTDEKILLLRTFLLVLWQQGRLTQLPCDPLDLRVARPKERLTDVDNKLDRKELETASATETSAHVVVEALSTQVTTATDAEDPNEEKDSSTQPRGLVVAVDSSATAETIEKNLSEEDDVIQTVEDLPLELMGPLDINLKRIDYYHPLFSTYRKSDDLRKKFFLESKHIVNARKLSGIDVYDYGFKFNRTVLQMTAPSLQELDVSDLRNMEELKVLEDIPFPKLRRLNIQVSSIEHENNPFEFAPPGEGHSGLRWLRCRLPRPALQSLLRHNAKSLLELYVEVGTPRGFERDQWPTRCEDLHSMLGECGFSSLRRLVLLRGEGCWHTRASCYDQVRDVRKALPGVLVECESCRPG